MTENQPLLSIIIPCYNDPQFINESVDSAIAQSYLNKEIILVDDGSNLETKKVLSTIKSKIDLVITQENRGLSSARNEGIKESKGEYIVVLDSDDFFEPDFCEKASQFMKASKNIKVVTCYARRFDENGLIDIYKPVGGKIENFLLSNAAIGNALYRKNDWELIGGYDEEMIQGYEDWEFYIRLLEKGGEAMVIQEPLFNYRQKKRSMRTDANKIKFELQRYIYNKHADLYKQHYSLFIDHLLERIRREEEEKIKNLNRLEFSIGKIFLKPLRFIKRKFFATNK